MSTATQPQQQTAQPQPEQAKSGPSVDQIIANTVVDDSQFANYIDTKRFGQLWKVASGFARSTMVPEHFQGKPDNCFIAVQMAIRLGVDPFMFMQKSYIVHGKPGMEAQLAIALVNSSGIFQDAIDYEVDGDDPNKYSPGPYNQGTKKKDAPIKNHDKPYRVRAIAVRKSTGKTVAGPWIDWPTVEGEGWHNKDGSKWLTMPGLMFMYRAATFFARMHCPERLMGMNTVDELFDIDDMRQATTSPASDSGQASPRQPPVGLRSMRRKATANNELSKERSPEASQAQAQTATAVAEPPVVVNAEALINRLWDSFNAALGSRADLLVVEAEVVSELKAKRIDDVMADDLMMAVKAKLEEAE